MKILGLKLSRYLQWARVLVMERKTVTVAALWRAFLSPRVCRRVWRARLRRCPKCPIYDRENRRCRALVPDRFGGPAKQLGCGCYTPFLAAVYQPYLSPGCWIRVLMGRPYGWE